MNDCILTTEFSSINNGTLEYLDKVIFSIDVAAAQVDTAVFQMYPSITNGGYVMKILNCPLNAYAYIDSLQIGEGESGVVNFTSGSGYWRFSAAGTYQLEVSHLIGISVIEAIYENANPIHFKRCYSCVSFKVGYKKVNTNTIGNYSIEPFVEALSDYRYIDEEGTISINVYGIKINNTAIGERPGVKLQFSSGTINVVDYQNTSTRYAQFNRTTGVWTYD